MREYRYISLDDSKPPNVFVQALAVVAAFGIFVLAVIVGGIVLAGLVGLILIAMTVIWARVWWLRRKIEKAMREQQQMDGVSVEDVVEGEYRVIEISDDDDSARQ